jgi:hypothetical protein
MAKKEFKPEKNRGWLFRNDYKNHDNPEDKSPDYKGTFNFDGEVKKISLWKSTTKKGDPMLKLSIYEPQGGAKPTNIALSDDDLPF